MSRLFVDKEAIEVAIGVLSLEQVWARNEADGGRFTLDVTPPHIKNAMAKLRAALEEAVEPEPVEMVQAHGNWRYSSHDDESFCGYCCVRESFKNSKPCNPRLEPKKQ
jgi:hypothetical protein